jgi:hypothetical protein
MFINYYSHIESEIVTHVLKNVAVVLAYAVKTCRGVEVLLYLFLTSALYGGEWSASRSGRLLLSEKSPEIHCVGGWMSLTAGLDVLDTRKISFPLPAPSLLTVPTELSLLFSKEWKPKKPLILEGIKNVIYILFKISQLWLLFQRLYNCIFIVAPCIMEVWNKLSFTTSFL